MESDRWRAPDNWQLDRKDFGFFFFLSVIGYWWVLNNRLDIICLCFKRFLFGKSTFIGGRSGRKETRSCDCGVDQTQWWLVLECWTVCRGWISLEVRTNGTCWINEWVIYPLVFRHLNTSLFLFQHLLFCVAIPSHFSLIILQSPTIQAKYASPL